MWLESFNDVIYCRYYNGFILKVKAPSTQQRRFVNNILNNKERKPIQTTEHALKVCSEQAVYNNGVSYNFVNVLQMHNIPPTYQSFISTQ
jgi:hypothetical protein